MIELYGQIKPVRLHGQLNVLPSNGDTGGPLQSKTVYPSHSQQIITPDEDYYGLASVKVEPVPKLKTAEAIFFEHVGGFKTGVEIGTGAALYEKTEV